MRGVRANSLPSGRYAFNECCYPRITAFIESKTRYRVCTQNALIPQSAAFRPTTKRCVKVRRHVSSVACRCSPKSYT